MSAEWSWSFEAGSFVLRDPTGNARASAWVLRDGRWAWTTGGVSSTTKTLRQAVIEILAALGLNAGEALFLAELADDAIERAGEEELGDD